MINRRKMFTVTTLALAGLRLPTASAAEGAAGAVGGSGSAAGGAVDGAPAGAHLPRFEFVYECDVTLTEALDFGTTTEGHRRIIPITGGTFKGPKLQGTVVPGGADWNLARSDGVGSVDADYYLKTDDGVYLRIVNKGQGGGPRPAPAAGEEPFFMYTHPVLEAPAGKYDWLNKSMYIGTLGARVGVKNAVLIRVYRLV